MNRICPEFKINPEGNTEISPHSNERELYCSVMGKLNDFLKYMEHNKLNLSQAETSDLHDILSVVSMSLDNCE